MVRLILDRCEPELVLRRADRECITFISDTLAGRQTFQLDLLSDLYS